LIYLKEGNIPLNLCTDDDISQQENNTYQLTFKYPVSDEKWSLLQNEVHLLADDLSGEQEFVIIDVQKEHGYITVYANQVATLLNGYSIRKINVDRANGFTVMNKLVEGLKRECPFTFFSDISELHTLNIENVSVIDALLKGQHSIIGQWGGDLVRDKYSVRLLKNGGIENQSLFMYKKNLSEYKESNTTKSLKTRIHFRKVITASGEGEKDQVLEATVDSPLVDKYKHIYEDDMEVQDQDVKTIEDLKEYGKKYFQSSLCDLPDESLEIDVLGHADQPVKLFDTVSIFYELYNIDIRKKITSYNYSPMSKKLKKIGFGKISRSLGGAIGKIVDDIVKEKIASHDAEYEAKVQKLVDNANAEYEKRAKKIENKVTDGIEEAKAKAEVVKEEINGIIAQKILESRQLTDSEIAKANVKAQEALDKAGAIPDTNQLSYQIKQQILNSPDLSRKVTETFNQTESGVIYNKIYQNIREEFTSKSDGDYLIAKAGLINQKLDDIDNKIAKQTVEFNKLTESNRLYERVLGTSETGAPDRLSRLVMSSEIFQTEVGKYVTDDNNLIVNSMTMDKNTLVNASRKGVEIFVRDGVFTIKAQELTSYNFSGFTLPIYVKKIYRGETYTLGFKYRIREKVDTNFVFVIKNHKLNKGLLSADLANPNTQASDEWREFQRTFTVQEDFLFGEDSNYPFYIYMAKNGWIEFKEPILVRGSNTGPYKPSQFDDAYKTANRAKELAEATHTQVTQLAGSYAIENFNSAGDIISGINLGADGNNRFVGKLTHITGETQIDNAVIKSAMVDKLKTGNFESGSVTTQIIASNAVTADKLLVDSAMINKLVSNQAFIRELTSQKAFITQLDSIDIAANRFTGDRIQSSDGSLVFDLVKNQLIMSNNTAAIVREDAGYPTQFIRYESSIEQNQKHSRTIIGSNRNGSKNWNSVSFSGIVIDNNSNNSVDKVFQYGDYNHMRHASGDDGWNFSVVTQTLTPGLWKKNSEIWCRHFVIPKKTKSDTDNPTEFIRLDESVAALWKLWAHALGQINMSGAMKAKVQNMLDTFSYDRDHIK
jgi:phage minor structural protein, N-terminal domain protein